MQGAGPEVCNGLDDDCDGEIDDGLLVPYYRDIDGDGHGVAGDSRLLCSAEAPYTATSGDDCDDLNSHRYPGAPETLGDCVDSDCDGMDFFVGDGRDGDLVVSGNSTLSLLTTNLASTALSLGTELTLTSAYGFSAGQVILVRVTSSSNPDNVGLWEMHRVASVSGNILGLAEPLKNTYPAPGTTVSVVPQYRDVTVTGTLAAAPWDGSKGGVLAMLVSGRLKVAAGGRIFAAGAGYRGGARSTSATQVGQQGESPKGTGIRTTSANLSGGGGGSAPSLTHADGGGGGYGTAGATGGSCCPGYTRTPGAGGDAVGDAALNRLLFGGGGGSGGLDADPGPTAYGGAGGAGGGAIVVIASTLVLDGTIDASGANGEDGRIDAGASPGGGGGGAGGAIYVVVKTVESALGTLRATGGTGGVGSEAGNSQTQGGSGGNGRIRVVGVSNLSSTPAAYVSCP